ncbi:MAG: hypothetical protein E4H16_02760 [Candidatus Atribacteria bacterium]|nr:MAG: hypothetical protein E4H16_02760 [Candidatus Atribacteria bacterium]
MAARTEAEQKELVRIWDAQERELAELFSNVKDSEDLFNYLEENVLEMKREQHLSDKKWVTSFYTFVTGTGGPHVEFNTNHIIAVYWAGGVQEYMTYDERAIKIIDMLADTFDEIYPQ